VKTFSWSIDEPLVKGSANPTDQDLRDLGAQGFTSAVSLLIESKQPPRYYPSAAEATGWSIYRISVEEGRAPSLDQISDFMTHLTALPEGTKVLVFCEIGRGRTACMGAAYLIAKGLGASSAIARVSVACSDAGWPIAERRRVLREYERLQGSQ
jgi:protein-tyrosine phosphatase